jgi:hypothetical protein
MPGQNPPQCGVHALESFEPLTPAPHYLSVETPENVLSQGLDIRPDGQVDEDAVVVRVRPECCGVSIFGLEAPHEAWGPFRQGVDLFQASDETLHDGIGDRAACSADVHLGEVPLSGCHHPEVRDTMST